MNRHMALKYTLHMQPTAWSGAESRSVSSCFNTGPRIADVGTSARLNLIGRNGRGSMDRYGSN
jgi:hypothetical protein